MVPAAMACAASNATIRIPIGLMQRLLDRNARELSTIPHSTQTEARLVFRDSAASPGRDNFPCVVSGGEDGTHATLVRHESPRHDRARYPAGGAALSRGQKREGGRRPALSQRLLPLAG